MPGASGALLIFTVKSTLNYTRMLRQSTKKKKKRSNQLYPDQTPLYATSDQDVHGLGIHLSNLGPTNRVEQNKQEAHGPRVAHLSDIATADTQMLCNIFPILSSQLMKRSSFKQFFTLKKIYGMPVNWAWSFEQTLNGSQLRFTIGTILAIFDLRVTPMLPTKFQVNWPFSSGEEAKNRFSRWLPWWPSWISG